MTGPFALVVVLRMGAVCPGLKEHYKFIVPSSKLRRRRRMSLPSLLLAFGIVFGNKVKWMVDGEKKCSATNGIGVSINSLNFARTVFCVQPHNLSINSTHVTQVE